MTTTLDDIEMGHIHEDLPPPPPPSGNSVWRGRLLSTLAPTLSACVALFETSYSIFYFATNNNVLGGIHATAAVASCCVSGCFWKYYLINALGKQAKSFEEQLQEQKNIEIHLREDLIENQQNVIRLENQAKEWQQREEEFKLKEQQFLSKQTELTNSLNQAVQELDKLVPLKEQLDSSINKLKTENELIKNKAPEINQKTQQMQAVINSLASFPQELTKKINELNTQDFKKEIARLEELINELKIIGEKFIQEYTNTQTEHAELLQETENLKKETEDLQKQLRNFDTIIKQLREVEKEYHAIVPQLEEIQKLQERLAKRKKIKRRT